MLYPITQSGATGPQTVGWRVVRGNSNQVDEYDALGRQLRQIDADGHRRSYTYSDANTPAAIAPKAGLLIAVSDNFGRSLQYRYDAAGNRVAMIDPDGRSTTYEYEATPLPNCQGPQCSRIVRVNYPDGSSRRYHWDEAAHSTNPGDAFNLLTGISDETGQRYSTYRYANGLAQSTELAGGVNRYTLSQFSANVSTTVQDPLGNQRTYRFDASSGLVQLTRVEGPACPDCGAPQRSYDGNGNLTRETDWKGVRTDTAYEYPRNLPTTRTEAAGTPQARTTTTAWHPDWRLAARVAAPGRLSTYVYNGQPDPSAGNAVASCAPASALLPTGKPIAVLCKQIEQATLDNSGAAGFGASLSADPARLTQYSYDARGLMLTMTDAGGGLWRYTYDTAGNRVRERNPLGHETNYVYDGSGRVLRETAPNGLITQYSYDARGRLTLINRGGEASFISYHPTGQLAAMTVPGGYGISYYYDGAQRLVRVADTLGNRVDYTLDAAGNRVREETRDSSNQLALASSRVINALNRVASVQGAAGQTTRFDYDANGDPISTTNAFAQTTSYTLDALRRLSAIRHPDNAQATLAYNGQGRVATATDPKGVTSQTQYNGFGELVAETSPDSGGQSYQRDALGNVVAFTDARANTATLSRDALGRLTRIDWGGGQVYEFSYDQNSLFGTNQTGYLSRLVDPSGSTDYSRDALGRVVRKTVRVASDPANPPGYTVSYSWADGRIRSLTYASGLRVYYTRNAGRVSDVRVMPNANFPTPGVSDQPFASDISYTALGQPKAWTWRNGLAAQRQYNTDGQLTNSEIGNYSYNSLGQLASFNQKLRAQSASGQQDISISWNAAYDNRQRLSYLARDGAQSYYSYDANGNRRIYTQQDVQDVSGDGTLDYFQDLLSQTQQLSTISPGTNRQQGFNQTSSTRLRNQMQSYSTSSVNYQYDAAGNLTSDGLRNFDYDKTNRLAKVRILRNGEAAQVKYLTNALGQRVFKTEVLAEQTLPSQTTLGSGFVNWLSGNFGWLFTQTPSTLGTTYIYDEQGRLLSEYDNGSPQGNGRTDYIWLPLDGPTLGNNASQGGQSGQDAMLIGMFKNNQFYAIHTDHLGTPRRVSDEQKQVVWQLPFNAYGDSQPSGVLQATTDARQSYTHRPSLLKTSAPTIELNLRFPGQYYDEESKLHYNYFRSYQAAQGRYTQPDPIGLEGGWNRFGYVGGDPVNLIDPLGLVNLDIGGPFTVHANPGPNATDFRPEHGPPHVHIGGNDGPRWRIDTWEPFSEKDARQMTREQRRYCEQMDENTRNIIRSRQQEVFDKGTFTRAPKGGGRGGGGSGSIPFVPGGGGGAGGNRQFNPFAIPYN